MEIKDLYKKILDTSNYQQNADKKIEESYKDGVQIIAKTIDMVNPYEYSRGLDYEMNMANNAVGDWMEEDLTTETIKKASKKVLKNLTKDAQYYQKKVAYQMEGDSMYDIEVNKKSIEALKKTNGKIMKEGKTSFLDEQTYTMYADKYDTNEATPDDIAELGRNRDAIYEKYAKRYEVDINELKDRVEARRLEKEDVNEAMDKTTKSAIADEIAQWREGNLSKEQLKKSLMDLSDGEFQLDSIKGFNNEMKSPAYSSSSQKNQYAQRGGTKLTKQGKEDHKKTMSDFAKKLVQQAKEKGIDIGETIEAPDAATALELQKKDPKAYIKIADK